MEKLKNIIFLLCLTGLYFLYVSFNSTLFDSGMRKFQHFSGEFLVEYSNNFKVFSDKEFYYFKNLESDLNQAILFEKSFLERSSFKSYLRNTLCKNFECKQIEDLNSENLLCFSNWCVLKHKDFNIEFLEPKNIFTKITKKEALVEAAKILALRKGVGFDDLDYSESCFDDVLDTDLNFKWICYAKDQGLVIGVNGILFEDHKLNLFGALKFLSKAYEINDFEKIYKSSDLEFKKMTEFHYGYALIKNSLESGLIDNPSRLDIWPNQIVYKAEWDLIKERFHQLARNKKLYVSHSLDSDFDFTIFDDSDLSLEFDKDLFPKQVQFDDTNFRIVNVEMSNYDFWSILNFKTRNTRYNAMIDNVIGEIKTRGFGSRSAVKSSFSLDLSNQTNWKLKSFVNDGSFTFEKLTYDTFKKLGYWSPDYKDVLLKMNNNVFGSYQMTEKVDQKFMQKRNLDVQRFYYVNYLAGNNGYNLTDVKNDDLFNKLYDFHGENAKEHLEILIEKLKNND